MDATLQLLSDCAQDREARHAAELRVWHLDRELTERTAAWPKERGTLSMRGVTGECLPSDIAQAFTLFGAASAVLKGQCLSYQHLVGYAMLGLLMCRPSGVYLAAPAAAEPSWSLP